jgi:hypothetical protein
MKNSTPPPPPPWPGLGGGPPPPPPPPVNQSLCLGIYQLVCELVINFFVL